MVAALDSSALARILTDHVRPARRGAATIIAGGPTQATHRNFPGTTPSASDVDASSGVKLTDAAYGTATITTADVAASLGVIHVIDNVLLPAI